jgi:hypothetical protein
MKKEQKEINLKSRTETRQREREEKAKRREPYLPHTYGYAQL